MHRKGSGYIGQRMLNMASQAGGQEKDHREDLWMY